MIGGRCEAGIGELELRADWSVDARQFVKVQIVGVCSLAILQIRSGQVFGITIV